MTSPKSEREVQAELRAADRSTEVAVEPDHQPVATIGKPKPIQAVLVDVMRDVREIKKSGKYEGGRTRYDFRGIEHVLNQVGPAFRTHGVISLPHLLDWERDQYTTSGGSTMTRYVVKVRYTFEGPAGDTVDVIVPGEGADSADKAMSKAMAVALRTALIQLLSIPTEDEDGESTRAEAAPPPTEAQGNMAGAILALAVKASTPYEIGELWERATAEGVITVPLSGRPLSEHLTEIGTRLQGQVSP
jgi:hypothetical protein